MIAEEEKLLKRVNQLIEKSKKAKEEEKNGTKLTAAPKVNQLKYLWISMLYLERPC